ncbi:TRAP transporter small permease [Algihabitans albus]|uniref:TRAP transporter small permease n=1 Tax=Algihabitans albus TaxID=2164067 RepID=UPI000E5CDE51|nr:TRAP transporter small permease [Algihabitans albus]
MIERLIHRAALSLALAGGGALLAMTGLTVVSVTGRGLIALGLGPVPGDYELVEMAAAFAIFSFLPWCQLQRGHVTVDLFMAPLGRRVNLAADLIGNLLLTAAAGVIAWRLWLGLQDRLSFGETSFILGIPLWIGYVFAALGAALFVVVSAYTALRSLRELRETTAAPTSGPPPGKGWPS